VTRRLPVRDETSEGHSGRVMTICTASRAGDIPKHLHTRLGGDIAQILWTVSGSGYLEIVEGISEMGVTAMTFWNLLLRHLMYRLIDGARVHQILTDLA